MKIGRDGSHCADANVAPYKVSKRRFEEHVLLDALFGCELLLECSQLVGQHLLMSARLMTKFITVARLGSFLDAGEIGV